VSIAPVRLTLDDIESPPRETFVIGSMIPFAKSSVLYGPTSVGKSALAAQIAFAFAGGSKSLWDLTLCPDGGPVLVFTAEDSLDDWKRKGAAIRTAGGIDVARSLERLYVADQSEGLARLSEALAVREPASPETPERMVTRRLARPTDEQEGLIAMALDVGARLILVETASRLVDEEDNPSFAALQSALGRIARETGAAVLLTHHSTKAASKENDNAIESARGGGSLVANARNALALFPADLEAVKPYRDRFPVEDVFTLAHVKGTSSTRRSAPLVLVRTDATWGAVFRLPDEVELSPAMERVNAERLEAERQREQGQLCRLFEVVAKVLPVRPSLSPSWLRDSAARDLGVAKHRVEPLVQRALDIGVLRVHKRTDRGITITLGVDPRKPIDAARANPGESQEDAA
jgi:hypothetical protein